jgi:membrane-associated phospholipid phosphatase
VTTSRRRAVVRWGPGPALAAVVAGCAVVAAGLYGASIKRAHDVGREGRANALALEDAEASLGLGWTHDLANTWLTTGPMRSFWVFTYALGYWPFLALAAGWTIRFDTVRLRQLVAVIGVTGLVGVTIMTVFPVSPPRLSGALDPIAGTTVASIAHPEALMNEHGAMPSFHVAWSVAAAATLANADGPWRAGRRICWIQPVLMVCATVATGNHWVSDAAAGLLLIAISWRPVSAMVSVTRRHLRAERVEDERPGRGRSSMAVDAPTRRGHPRSRWSPGGGDVASRRDVDVTPPLR